MWISTADLSMTCLESCRSFIRLYLGWSAHRIEELIDMDKIIRPAYMSVMEEKE